MAKVKAQDFREYAGHNQERWSQLIGSPISHPVYKQGVVIEVDVNNGEVLISIAFDNGSGGIKQRQFDARVMEEFGEIELPVTNSLPPLRDARKSSSTLQITREQPQEMAPARPNPSFALNQEVCLVNNISLRGRISAIKTFTNGEWNYEIYFSSSDIRIYRESAIKLYKPIVKWGSLDDLLRDLALVKLRKPQSDMLYAINASRTKFEVYQFKPAVKFLANPDQRLLIADEVGLGKTIEAGIIYLELQARLGLDRVLIVCPASLRHKWQDEMKSRFDEEFVLMDINAARRFIDQYHQYGDQIRLRGIISLELIRRQELIEAFGSVKLDMLIIDEAHHCRNTGTLTNAVASVLTENSDAALMLTATPLQMGQQDLFNLLNILAPGEFDDFQVFLNRLEPNSYINRAAHLLAAGKVKDSLNELRYVEQTTEKQRFIRNPYYQTVLKILEKDFPSNTELITAQRRLLELNTLSSVFARTRKRDISTSVPIRTAFTLTVNFTPQEKAIYEQAIEEVREEFRARHWNNIGSGWVTVMKERQAASCISALIKRQQEKNPVKTREEDTFESEFLSSKNELEESTEDGKNNYDNDSSAWHSKGRVTWSHIQSLPKGYRDSKFEVFYEALRKVLDDDNKCKVIVFSFFVGTIEHIFNELSQRGVRCKAIHGGYRVNDRHKILEEFEDDPSYRVLISSEVGSEGLDFQFCDTIFNYDLPWNPMRVEQRIGRIDRFGQQSERIRIYNLVIEDSIESRILMRLYERIEIFKHAIGDIEVILGDQIRELTQAVFTNRLSPAEEIQKAEQAVINIMRQKQDMEEFEKNKLQFLGQEAILSQAIERTLEAGRFVSDVELRALIEGYVKDKFPLSRFESNGANDNTYSIFANDDLVNEVKSFILNQRKNDLSAQQFLIKLRPGVDIPITFLQEMAFQRKLLEFITPRHPLAQAALEHWKRNRDQYKLLSKFKIITDEAPAGHYFFFIFSIDTEGIERDSRLIPVVISQQSGDLHISLSKQFLRLLQTCTCPFEILAGPCDDEALREIEESAVDYMSRTRDELHEELITANEVLVNARITAVEQSYQAKVQRIEGTLNKVSNASIQRMYRAQLNNLAAKKNSKVSDINKGRLVNVSFSHQLRGYVEVINA